MPQIVLTDEQVKVISEALGEVMIIDQQGNPIGYLRRNGLSPENIAAAEKRLATDGPWHETKDVVKHLRSLENE